MDKKEKYRAEMDSRLIKFDQTLHEIKTEMERRKENRPELRIDDAIRKQEDAKAKVNELERSGEFTWNKVKLELDDLVHEIDEVVKAALTYLK